MKEFKWFLQVKNTILKNTKTKNKNIISQNPK